MSSRTLSPKKTYKLPRFRTDPLPRRFRKWFYLLRGKVRRYYLCHFRMGYVRYLQSFRRGACARCGRCCTLLCQCPFAIEDNQCTIYERRPRQCREFPIDPRDLRERAFRCGYWFVYGPPPWDGHSPTETPPAARNDSP